MTLVQVIRLLAPFLAPAEAGLYADSIARYARGLDPHLVVAVIYVESRFRKNAKSRTNDYGLMQLHVSATTRPRYFGRERKLLDPRHNIRLGIRALRAWKRFHGRKCRSPHHWLGHYQQGRRVHSAHYAEAVLAVYGWIKSARMVAAK